MEAFELADLLQRRADSDQLYLEFLSVPSLAQSRGRNPPE